MAERYPHIDVTPTLWQDARPRTSATAHLFVKAIDLVERDQTGEVGAYPDRLSTRAAWEIRRAFFAAGRDISDWQVLAEIVEQIGVDYDAVESKIRTSEAVARLVVDADLSRASGVAVSPTLIMNDGRQKLHGNVGYRLIEANVQELLRRPGAGEASWC